MARLGTAGVSWMTDSHTTMVALEVDTTSSPRLAWYTLDPAMASASAKNVTITSSSLVPSFVVGSHIHSCLVLA